MIRAKLRSIIALLESLLFEVGAGFISDRNQGWLSLIRARSRPRCYIVLSDSEDDDEGD